MVIDGLPIFTTLDDVKVTVIVMRGNVVVIMNDVRGHATKVYDVIIQAINFCPMRLQNVIFSAEGVWSDAENVHLF